jgi:hypothetical protein
VPVNVTLHAKNGQSFAAGTFPVDNNMIVLVTGAGGSHARYGIAIKNPPPPYVWYDHTAGGENVYHIDGQAVWVFNEGPSDIQVYNSHP